MSDVSAMFGAAASNDEKKGLEGGGGLGKFGLNQNARITKFEINTMAGKGQTPGLAVDINVTASGKEVRRRIFEPNKVYPSRRSWERFNNTAAPIGVFGEKGDLDMLFNLATAFLGFEAAVACEVKKIVITSSIAAIVS